MKIRSFVHKGLKRLYLEDSAKGLPADAVDKLRAMLTFLQDMRDPEKLRASRFGKPTNSAGTAGESGACTSRANWRLTFRINDGEISDIDYEDYH